MLKHASVPVLLVSCLMLAVPPAVQARIKLITLPIRERVEIQLEHPAVTLVEEERIVPLVAGENQVDFSWANTQIDAVTILLRILAPDEEAVRLLSVSYPPGENALIWQVAAKQAGSARMRISYVLTGLQKRFSYRALTSQDEKTLHWSQYLAVENYANEEYPSSGIWVGVGGHLSRPLNMGETRQVLLNDYPSVALQKTYTADLQAYGYLNEAAQKLRVPMHYVLKNDAAHQLGQFALPAGKVRIFQADNSGGSAFIGEDWGQFTPLDDELKLYLGLAQDIVVKRTIEKSEQQVVAGNLYRHKVVIKYEIENFKNAPLTLDVREDVRALRNQLRGDNGRDVAWTLGEDTSFPGGLNPEKSTYQQLVFQAPLPPRQADGQAKKIVHRLALWLDNEWQ